MKDIKEIKVSGKIYRDPNSQVLETDYIGGHIESHWVNARPELLPPNIKEWFIHNILRKHFSFGQPFCVVCGREELKEVCGGDGCQGCDGCRSEKPTVETYIQRLNYMRAKTHRGESDDWKEGYDFGIHCGLYVLDENNYQDQEALPQQQK